MSSKSLFFAQWAFRHAKTNVFCTLDCICSTKTITLALDQRLSWQKSILLKFSTSFGAVGVVGVIRSTKTITLQLTTALARQKPLLSSPWPRHDFWNVDGIAVNQNLHTYSGFSPKWLMQTQLWRHNLDDLACSVSKFDALEIVVCYMIIGAFVLTTHSWLIFCTRIIVFFNKS